VYPTHDPTVHQTVDFDDVKSFEAMIFEQPRTPIGRNDSDLQSIAALNLLVKLVLFFVF
jgi:hypothetical protein